MQIFYLLPLGMFLLNPGTLNIANASPCEFHANALLDAGDFSGDFVERGILKGASQPILKYASHADNPSRVISVGDKGEVISWDIAKKKINWRLQVGPKSKMWAVEFFSNSERVLVGGEEGALFVLNTKNGKIIRTLSAPQGLNVPVLNGGGAVNTPTYTATTISADGRIAYVSSVSEGAVRVWDLQTGKYLKTFPVGAGPSYLEISRDNQALFMASALSLRVLDLASGKIVRNVNAPKTAAIQRAKLIEGTPFMASAISSEIQIINLNTGYSPPSIVVPKGQIMDFEFTKDLSFLNIFSFEGPTWEKKVHFYQYDMIKEKFSYVKEGQEFYYEPVYTQFSSPVTFSGDQAFVFSSEGRDNGMKVWQIPAVQ